MSLELFVKTGFAFCGVIHLLPVSGAMGASALQSLYGVSLADPNLILLMRHRASMFGIIGVFLGAAVVYKPWRPHAYAAGLCSMSSYLILALSDKWDSLNPFVQRVFWVDVAGLLWLGAAAMVSRGQRPF
eukprot:gene27694-33448_t